MLTVRLRGYTSYPLPENLTEEIAFEVSGARLDLEQLTAEITEILGGRRRRVQQSCRQMCSRPLFRQTCAQGRRQNDAVRYLAAPAMNAATM